MLILLNFTLPAEQSLSVIAAQFVEKRRGERARMPPRPRACMVKEPRLKEAEDKRRPPASHTGRKRQIVHMLHTAQEHNNSRCSA